MPMTKEEKREYHRQYREKNKAYFESYEHSRGEERKNSLEWKRKHRESCKKSNQKAWIKEPARMMLLGARHRAKRDGVEFTITPQDIEIPEFCPILETKLVFGELSRRQDKASLDRIDPTKGYIPGNVRVISWLANAMKNNATKEQCLLFAKNIVNYFDEKDPKCLNPTTIQSLLTVTPT